MPSLTLHYQPIFHRNSRRVLYYEALLRAPNTSTPNLFQSAERRQVRIPLEREALRMFWQDICSGHIAQHPVGLNLSPLALCEDQASWRLLLKISKQQPFFLEITEDLPVHDTTRYRDRLLRLRELGVDLVRDDLGSGHAHFTDLLEYPFSYGKLDRRYFHWWFPKNRSEENRRTHLESLLQTLDWQSCYLIQEGVEHELSPALLTQLPSQLQGLQGFGLGQPERTPWAARKKCPPPQARNPHEEELSYFHKDFPVLGTGFSRPHVG